MAQQAKGGSKTRTFKVNGQTYQQRIITCGKESCKACAGGQGHLAYYQDGGLVDGKRKWIYAGSQAPVTDPDYEQPRCQHVDCDNTVSRRNQKYCSARCRVAAHRALQSK